MTYKIGIILVLLLVSHFLNFTVMKIFLVESDIFDVKTLRVGLEQGVEGEVYSFFKPEEMLLYMEMKPDIIIYDKEIEIANSTDFRKEIVTACKKKKLPVNFKVISLVAGLEEAIQSIYEVSGHSVSTLKLPITKDIEEVIIDEVIHLRGL